MAETRGAKRGRAGSGRPRRTSVPHRRGVPGERCCTTAKASALRWSLSWRPSTRRQGLYCGHRSPTRLGGTDSLPVLARTCVAERPFPVAEYVARHRTDHCRVWHRGLHRSSPRKADGRSPAPVGRYASSRLGALTTTTQHAAKWGSPGAGGYGTAGARSTVSSSREPTIGAHNPGLAAVPQLAVGRSWCCRWCSCRPGPPVWTVGGTAPRIAGVADRRYVEMRQRSTDRTRAIATRDPPFTASPARSVASGGGRRRGVIPECPVRWRWKADDLVGSADGRPSGRSGDLRSGRIEQD